MQVPRDSTYCKRFSTPPPDGAALLRTALINCCERFSRALIGGGGSSGAQKRRRQGDRCEQGDGVRLGRLAVWKGSSGRPKGNCSSGCNGASESKAGNVKKTHGRIDKKD